ncbi:complex I NDUFA9 subunit family protein [Terrihabitans sp. B22-R8]|uniref:complex I NDUFA9 subunit family protein n=1 Tax=Terrihabitans sp. B22-R8 TaxID=3425128 RepID=UPI00403C0631
MVSDRIVTVFGGSGFIGRHVIRALAGQGFRVRNAVRRPDLAVHLQPLGTVGQIHSVLANVRNSESVRAAIEGADAVVNLTGILYESGKQTFEAVHVEGAERIAQAAAAEGIGTLVHMSALGADAESPSAYARSKAEGEVRVRAAFPGAAILRPSLVFGPEDDFFNRFAGMARISPFLPLIGGGKTRFQPVFAADVGDALAKLVDGAARPAIYELGGPEVKSFRQLMEYVLAVTCRKRLLLPLPFDVARFQASVLQLLPKPLLTVDQVEALRADNVVSEAAMAEGRTLEGLGIRPTSVENVVPTYLYAYRKAGQFTDIHAH